MIQKRRILFVAGLLALVLSASFAVFHGPTLITAQPFPCFPASTSPWDWEGECGTDPEADYVGTNDEQSLVLRAFGRIGLYLQPRDTSGNFGPFNTPWVGIGTTRPEAGLDVANGNLFIRDEPRIEGAPFRPESEEIEDDIRNIGSRFCNEDPKHVLWEPISDIPHVDPILVEWRIDCLTGSSLVIRHNQTDNMLYIFRVLQPQVRLESEPSFDPNIGPSSASHIVLSNPQGDDLEAARYDDVVIRSGGSSSDLPGSSIHIGVANVEKVRLASDGDSWFNVNNAGFGVGTDEPDAKFHVKGDSKLEGFATVTENLKLDGKLECTKCILSSDIEDDAVVPRILADNAVTSAKIDDGTIISADIDAQAVVSRTLATKAVTSDKIVEGAITSAHIADGEVTLNALAPGSVDASKVIRHWGKRRT